MAKIIVILLLLLFCVLIAAVLVWGILQLAGGIIEAIQEIKEGCK